jgi:hypothetical protein
MAQVYPQKIKIINPKSKNLSIIYFEKICFFSSWAEEGERSENNFSDTGEGDSVSSSSSHLNVII